MTPDPDIAGMWATVHMARLFSPDVRKVKRERRKMLDYWKHLSTARDDIGPTLAYLHVAKHFRPHKLRQEANRNARNHAI